MSFLDDLDDAPAEIVLAPTVELSRAEKADAALDTIQDSIFRESLQVVDDGLHFADIEPDMLKEGGKPPPEWVEELGQKGAERRMRVAGYCLAPKKDAPMGISLAASTVAAISNARARSNQGPKTLNVQFVQISEPLPVLEVMEVDK